MGLALGMPRACWRGLGAACRTLFALVWRLRLGLGEGARATPPSHTAPRQLAQPGCLGAVGAVTRHDSPPGCGWAVGRAPVPRRSVLGGRGDRFVAVSRNLGWSTKTRNGNRFSGT